MGALEKHTKNNYEQITSISRTFIALEMRMARSPNQCFFLSLDISHDFFFAFILRDPMLMNYIILCIEKYVIVLYVFPNEKKKKCQIENYALSKKNN